MKKLLSIIVVGLLLITFIGCGPERVSVYARYNSPYYRPPRPYPEYIWIEGNWYYDNGVRVYHQGYWAPPTRYHSGVTVYGHGERRWKHGRRHH